MSPSLPKCRKLFSSFTGKGAPIIDLSQPDTIIKSYEIARKRGVFELAKHTRKLVFGNDMIWLH